MKELARWYVETFTLEERQRIAGVFQPMVVGVGADAPRSNPIDRPPAQKLWALVGWFKSENDRAVALRLVDGAIRFASETLDRHFALQAAIELHYRLRAQPHHMEMAERFCRQQIAMAPDAAQAFRAEFRGEGRAPDFMPSHVGYKQLAIILEKGGDLGEAIDLCALAAEQGWRGDWDKRIERLQKRMAKQPNMA
jgi:hypothetical protein